MTDAMLALFPNAQVYHIGLFREKISLQPVECRHNPFKFFVLTRIDGEAKLLSCAADYSKLPANPTVDLVYLLDPLIATAGTAIAALTMIADWGIPSTSDTHSKNTANVAGY